MCVKDYCFPFFSCRTILYFSKQTLASWHPHLRIQRGRYQRVLPRSNFIHYRPQTKFAKVMFLQVSVCPHGGACMVLSGGRAWFYSRGGMCDFIWGGVRGFIWGGMRGFIRGGHAWFYSGGHAWFFQFFRIQ